MRPIAHGRSRLAVLDGLRLLAALMVVIYHYVVFGDAWGVPHGTVMPELSPVAAYGWLGVELFFLISGFVICMSGEGRSAGQFAVSRITRLYPAYWFAVALTTAVLMLWPSVRSPRGLNDALTNLTMFQDFLGVRDVDAVYWTLHVEVRFYLLFGVVVLLRGFTYRRVLAFAALWMLTSTVAHASDWDLLSMLTIPEEAPYFTAGIAFYLIYRYGPNLYLWGLVGFSWLIALNKLGHVVARQAKHMGAEGAADLPTAGAVVTVFFLIMAAIATRRLAVGWRWLTYAGAVTYPLYLLHEYIGWTLIHHLRGWLSPALLTTALVVAMLAFSWLVHRYVERPAAAWLRVRLTAARQALTTAGQLKPRTAPTPRVPLDHDMTVELKLLR